MVLLPKIPDFAAQEEWQFRHGGIAWQADSLRWIEYFHLFLWLSDLFPSTERRWKCPLGFQMNRKSRLCHGEILHWSKCLQAHQKLLFLQVAAQIPLNTHHMSVSGMIFISLTSTFQGQRKLLQGQCPKRRLGRVLNTRHLQIEVMFQRWSCSIPGTTFLVCGQRVGVLWLMMGQRSPQAPPLVASPTEFPALGGSSEECFGAGWRSCTMKVLGYTFHIIEVNPDWTL